VLRANLDSREITILRAYAKYLRQAGFPFSQAYMEQALFANPTIAKRLVQLFLARFDPTDLAEAGTTTLLLITEISHELDAVESLDEDRILRRFLAVIRATIRTNYFQEDASGERKNYLSLKFDPALVPDLPAPRPMFEIYVYSTRVEGVHMRDGKVARGGLRWGPRFAPIRKWSSWGSMSRFSRNLGKPRQKPIRLLGEDHAKGVENYPKRHCKLKIHRQPARLPP
jgi:glutamate dehydrogenase